MEEIIVIALGCVGAWLLVAGPLYQGALELREQELDQDAFGEAIASVDPLPPISPWWWLLPPVGWWKRHVRSAMRRQAVMQALGPDARRQMVMFFNKANGWFAVAGGAFLIAAKETWELGELVEWHQWITWVIVAVVTLLCLANAALQMARTGRVLGEEGTGGGRRGAERDARRRALAVSAADAEPTGGPSAQ